MLITSVEEEISIPFENGNEVLKFSDGINGISTIQEIPIITNNVVPENTQSDLSELISNLEEEIMGLKSKQKDLDEKRRGLLNKILDIKGSIRVFCRIRPLLWSNISKNDDPVVVDLDKVVVKSAGSKKGFDFDKVFCQKSTQEDVFVEVEPILRSALDGHNVCIFAYGQTGTGKTFTMDGMNDQLGIVPRALRELFHYASLHSTASVTFSMSMLEVYMGNLKDLLAPKPTRRAYEPVSRCNQLNVQVDAKGVVEIEGLTEVPISDFSKANWWYTKGRRARATSSTNVNDVSSRSHCLMRITISHHGDAPEGQTRTSKLWMVDLGGSERLLKTGATGLTLDEGRAINLSLSALGDVIASLRRKRTHVPYRNSKLTQILRDSLGNESKVLMIVHISPVEEDLGETICSMSFAKRARGIESNQELPQEIKQLKQKKIAELSDEMREAEEEYQKVRDQLQKAESLHSEKKQLNAVACDSTEDEENITDDTKIDSKEIVDTPCDSEKPIKRKSLPHYMTPTAISRLRHSASERQNHYAARVLRSGTRSSMQLSASQSLSFLEPRLKAVLRSASRHHPDKAAKNVPTETQNCSNVEPKPASSARNKPVTPSLVNSKPTYIRHRRRMSNLI
ncbi:kinesin-like protein KIN-14U [Chenopodium quinoa]|uniref:kinesin-like protein KIN-14U n=1 Tax=Chenopodium quinoa TaxID=63459 RepID=UPI000B77F1E1|nr:kinesin-like protein KIN-14U [Chenopodium quinoa]